MAQPVFLSYARQASKEFAQQVYAKLGPEQAFLDTEAIEHGDCFPGTLADAVLGARVVVIFANATYFRRWYCLRELKLALLPFDVAVRRSWAAADQEVLVQATRHVVVVLPPNHTENDELVNLPPQVRAVAWPHGNGTIFLTPAARLP